MAKVKITGHASGTGILTVTAPNTSTDRTITLPDATGTLATTADSVGGATGVDFNDSVKIRLGTGNDYELYHDGTNTYMDNNTGALFMRNNGSVVIEDLSGNNIIRGIDGGAVDLYHDGSAKLTTTSTGLTVTGAIAGATNLGKVLQVVSATVGANTTSTSSTFAAADASLTITPAATSSKILIQFMGGRCGFSGSGGGDGAIKLYQTISGGSATSVEGTDRGISNFFGFGDFYAPVALQFIASPNTTSAVTYQIYIARRSGTGTFSLSRDGSQSPNMTLMEIGA